VSASGGGGWRGLLCLAWLGLSVAGCDQAPRETRVTLAAKEAKVRSEGFDAAAVPLLKQVRELRRTGDATRALALVDAADESVRQDPRVAAQVIQALQDLRRFDEAAARIDDVQLPAGQTVLPLEIARMRNRIHNAAGSAILGPAQTLVEERPGNADLRAVAVRALLSTEDFAGARGELGVLADQDGTAWVVAELEAELAAAKAVSLMVTDELLDRAVPLLEVAVENAPQRGDVRALYVQALVRYQRFEVAEAEIAAGLKDGGGVDRIDLLIGRAELSRALGADDEAEAAYASVLEELPEHQEAMVGLARCRKMVGDNEAARELLESCLDARPDNLSAWLVLAELHESEGDLLAAENCLLAVLDERPNHLKACYRMSRLLARAGRMDEVDAYIERYEDRKRALQERASR